MHNYGIILLDIQVEIIDAAAKLKQRNSEGMWPHPFPSLPHLPTPFSPSSPPPFPLTIPSPSPSRPHSFFEIMLTTRSIFFNVSFSNE